MSDEEGIGGPLGELMSALPQADEQDTPREAVHTRVLPVPTAEGAELVFACWHDPGGAQALHAAMMKRVEGSLLGELTRTAEDLREEPSALTGLRLFVFADIPDSDRAVAAFGLSRTGGGDSQSHAALARVRHEASTSGESIPDAPRAIYAARTISTTLAEQAEEELVTITEDVWGKNPGAPFARLRQAITRAGGPTITPTLAGVDAAESALFTDDVGVIRWVGPLVFQALCDLIAVAIARELARSVDWAEAIPDDDGIAPPPMIRVDREIHVPLALEVLRWCVMPRRKGERVPPLSEWIRGAFAAP